MTQEETNMRLAALEKAVRAQSKRVRALEKTVAALTVLPNEPQAESSPADVLDEWQNGKKEGSNG